MRIVLVQRPRGSRRLLELRSQRSADPELDLFAAAQPDLHWFFWQPGLVPESCLTPWNEQRRMPRPEDPHDVEKHPHRVCPHNQAPVIPGAAHGGALILPHGSGKWLLRAEAPRQKLPATGRGDDVHDENPKQWKAEKHRSHEQRRVLIDPVVHIEQVGL